MSSKKTEKKKKVNKPAGSPVIRRLIRFRCKHHMMLRLTEDDDGLGNGLEHVSDVTPR